LMVVFTECLSWARVLAASTDRMLPCGHSSERDSTSGILALPTANVGSGV
jgi:hypothetical protein